MYLINQFFSGAGYTNTYLQEMPWARVLDIGLGGDPNFPSETQTPTMTGTPSMTGTGTPTSSMTPTPSMSGTGTPTSSMSGTGTPTPSMSGTGTPTSSQTATNMPSQTLSHTPTTTSTLSLNSTPSDSPTQTPTPSQTPSLNSTPSDSPTQIPIPSQTPSLNSTPSDSSTQTPTPSQTPSLNSTPSDTPTQIPTPSQTPSNITPTQTQTSTTATTSLSQTPSVTASINLQILPPVQQTPEQIISSTNRVTQLRSVSPSVSPEFNSANCLINSEACPNEDSNDYKIPLLAPSGAFIIVTEADPYSLIFSDNSDVVSDIFDVSLANPNAVLGGDVEICLKAKTKRENLCLGYLDESKSPPKWECEDRCLQIDDNGLICGETDHFTNFALLLDGNGSGSFDCGDDVDGWITNSWVGDFILIISCFAFCIVLGLIIVILGTLVPTFNQFIYGNEGHRIQKTRHASSLAYS